MRYQMACMVGSYREKKADDPKYKRYDGHQFEFVEFASDRVVTHQVTIPFGANDELAMALKEAAGTQTMYEVAGETRSFKGQNGTVIALDSVTHAAVAETRSRRAS